MIFFYTGAWAQVCATGNETNSDIQTLISGFKSLKRELTLDQATEVFRKLASNPLFHMNDPDGLCYERSQLIGKELESEGIYSEQLNIDCPSEFLYATDPYTGKVYKYGDHWANIVSIINPISHRKEEFVIDTQFQTALIPLSSYVKNIIRNGYKISEGNSSPTSAEDKKCVYRRVDRRSYQQLRDRLINKPGSSTKDLPDWFDKRISWDEKALESFKSDIRTSNKIYKRPDRKAPLSVDQINNAKLNAILKDLDTEEKFRKDALERAISGIYGPLDVSQQSKLIRETATAIESISGQRTKILAELSTESTSTSK